MHEMRPRREGGSPRIDYPVIWQYRIIGADPQALKAAAESCVGDRPYLLTAGNTSSGGRYRSLHLELEVRDEADRNALYQLLAGQPAVKVVL